MKFALQKSSWSRTKVIHVCTWNRLNMTWRNENIFSDIFSFFACTLLKCLQRYIKKGKCAFFALCESISNISQANAMTWHTKCMSMIHIDHVCFCPCDGSL